MKITHQRNSPQLLHEVLSREKHISQLLQQGMDPNELDDEGCPVLHRAVQQTLYRTVRLLLKHGAAPHLPDQAGFTAVHHAVLNSDHHMLELLLKYGADLAVQTFAESPLSIALKRKDELCIRILLAQGASDVTLTEELMNYRTESLHELTTREHFDRTKPCRLSQQELTQGKFLYWLERNSLSQYYELLLSAGFGSLEVLLDKTKGAVPLTTEELACIGFHRAGDRYKLLIRLDEEANISKRVKRLAIYTEAEGCCSGDPVELELGGWLEGGEIGELQAPLHAAGYDLELILLQGQSSYGFSQYILKHELGILDKRLRNSFLKHLRDTLSKRMADSFYYSRAKRCENCQLL